MNEVCKLHMNESFMCLCVQSESHGSPDDFLFPRSWTFLKACKTSPLSRIQISLAVFEVCANLILERAAGIHLIPFSPLSHCHQLIFWVL